MVLTFWPYGLLDAIPARFVSSEKNSLMSFLVSYAGAGEPNYIVRKILEYPPEDFRKYAQKFSEIFLMKKRVPIEDNFTARFDSICGTEVCDGEPFRGWHDDKNYLRFCMVRLWGRHFYNAPGDSLYIRDEEWDVIKETYKKITGEDYEI